MKKRLTTKDFKELIQSHWQYKCKRMNGKDANELGGIYKAFADFTEKLIREGKALQIVVKKQTLCFIWANGNGSYFLDYTGMDILLPQIEEICQERNFALKNYDLLMAIAA